MTITLTPAGGSAYTLCAGDARATDGTPSGPIDLYGGKQPGTIDREYIGAAGMEPEHIGCDRATLAFGVIRTFETAALASAAAVALKVGVPATGQLKIDDASYMAQARCTFTFGQVGCTLSVKYNLEGY